MGCAALLGANACSKAECSLTQAPVPVTTVAGVRGKPRLPDSPLLLGCGEDFQVGIPSEVLMTCGADLSKETDPSAPEPMLAGSRDKLACDVSSLERRQTLGWTKAAWKRTSEAQGSNSALVVSDEGWPSVASEKVAQKTGLRSRGDKLESDRK